MFEMVISPKWRRWEWMVCDCTGKVIVSGRELSRSRARYQAARAAVDGETFEIIARRHAACGSDDAVARH